MDEADPAVRIAALLEALHAERGRVANVRDSLLAPVPERVPPVDIATLSPAELARIVTEEPIADPAELDAIESQIESLDHRIDRIEKDLLQTPARSLAGVSAVLDFAVRRMGEQTVDDPDDVFFDYGSTRVLALLRRAAEDLRARLDPAALPDEDDSITKLPLTTRGATR